MKKYRLIVAFGLVTVVAHAQKIDSSGVDLASTEKHIVLELEQAPKFQDGNEALAKYIDQHVHLPEEVKSGKVKGKVFVAVVIDEQGNVTEPTVVKGLSKACDEEALRLIRQMPRWKPGRQNGKAVPVKFVLPVAFSQKTK